MSKEFMRGASASLNKTISEIESMLAGEKIGISGKLRKKLRDKLKEMLEEVAKKLILKSKLPKKYARPLDEME